MEGNELLGRLCRCPGDLLDSPSEPIETVLTVQPGQGGEVLSYVWIQSRPASSSDQASGGTSTYCTRAPNARENSSATPFMSCERGPVSS